MIWNHIRSFNDTRFSLFESFLYFCLRIKKIQINQENEGLPVKSFSYTDIITKNIRIHF